MIHRIMSVEMLEADIVTRSMEFFSFFSKQGLLNIINFLQNHQNENKNKDNYIEKKFYLIQENK